MTDWVAWHRGYDDPSGSLARRVQVVRRRIGEALGLAPPGPLRVVSLCAGDGRDLLPVLAEHPRRRDVTALLVELTPALADAARRRAAEADATVEVRIADAGSLAAWADWRPADLLLLCGIFGNVSVADIEQTVALGRWLVEPGGCIVWTRGALDHDLRPWVRSLFVGHGFDELGYDGDPEPFGVGLARAPATRTVGEEPPDDARLFTFVR